MSINRLCIASYYVVVNPHTHTGGGGMPGSLGGLTEDQLRSLEGMERANVEARITVLRNIQRLLDAAVAQMVQYSTVMASMG